MDTVGAEIVAPETAHPAFNKAAHLMNLRVVRVPVGADYKADPEAMAAAMGERTIMAVASAPCFPYGLVDPVPEVAAAAAERGVWCPVPPLCSIAARIWRRTRCSASMSGPVA
jgi:glutamate/tyrosine decarboxylase-like PLP-dependent enzyme